jgi:hypothetical protein
LKRYGYLVPGTHQTHSTPMLSRVRLALPLFQSFNSIHSHSRVLQFANAGVSFHSSRGGFTRSSNLTPTKSWNKIRRKSLIEETDQHFDVSNFQAIVGKVIYHNDSNGYSVLVCSPQNQTSKEVTIVGSLFNPTEGEHIQIRGGSWVNRGEERQIAAQQLVPINPSTRSETEIYLSKFFKGIGIKRAKDIVNMFGLKVFDVIENNPSALLKVPGLGSKNLESIIKPYLEKVSARELVDFLVTHG